MDFILKQDIQVGFIPNTNGKPNILFRKGDNVSGEIYTRYIFNKNMEGIDAFPTVSGAHIETIDGKHFLPLETLLSSQQSKEGFFSRNWKWLLGGAAALLGISLAFGGKGKK
jgi:hypothetical protein